MNYNDSQYHQIESIELIIIILNENDAHSKNEKQEQRDTQTRQSSGNKLTKQSSFKQMVKNSYEFYLGLGKDKIKEEQERVALQKEEKIKKLIKKQYVSTKRQHQRQQQKEKIEKTSNRPKQVFKKKKIDKFQTNQPLRKSLRNKNPVSYKHSQQPIDDQQIFDVLCIGQQQSNSHRAQQGQVSGLNRTEINDRRQSMIEKIQKTIEELIFEDEGTYEIGVAHESLLKAQKFIDQHINFKHEIRETKYIEVSSLMKYVKTHGFATFDEKKFNLLIKINPYLYDFSDLNYKNERYIITFKLNGLEIDKRQESTRRRMTQVSIPELFT